LWLIASHTLLSQGLRPSIPPACDAWLAKLIRECWNEDKEKRPPLSRVVAQLEAEVERLAATREEAAAGSPLSALPGRDAALLREVRRREEVLRAAFEAAQHAETDAEFVVELKEAAEELRSLSIDPIAKAALVDTHDDMRGFRRGKRDKEAAAREAAEKEARKAAEAAARAHGPDAPPGEWTDDEVLDAVARSEAARAWAFACAGESEAEFAAALDARLDAAEKLKEFDRITEEETELMKTVSERRYMRAATLRRALIYSREHETNRIRSSLRKRPPLSALQSAAPIQQCTVAHISSRPRI